ncbi:MAG: hypothetical protein ABIA12_00785 [Candidatus Aenigmatarchaeota archaeon]
MEMRMETGMRTRIRTTIAASLVMWLLIAGAATAASSTSVIQTGSTYMAVGMSSLRAVLLNQDPYPADPGSYVTLLFKLENWGTSSVSDVTFSLVPAYPFSLDPGADATVQLGNVGSLAQGSMSYFVKYKVKVDADAIGGENEITVRYGNGTSMSQQTFNVSVDNPRTDFEIVSQGSTSSAANLAVANVGANTAYSTIVRIPEQTGIRTTGTSASVVGNLNAGDYTLVSFEIASVGASAAAGTNSTFVPESLPAGQSASPQRAAAKEITVEVSYTDGLGIRRTVLKSVALEATSASGAASGSFSSTRSSGTSLTQFTNGSGLTYIAVGLGGIAAVLVAFRLMRRKKHEAK